MTAPTRIAKRPTWIVGLDTMTRGGLPTAGATLIDGATGTGKTVLAMEIAARAAREGVPSVFVSFEESGERLRTAAAAFSWGDALDESGPVRFVSARPTGSEAASGAFDLDGLLAVLDSLADGDVRPWTILDGIDQLLAHEPEDGTALRQLARLDAWAERTGAPVLLTGKLGGAVPGSADLLAPLEFLMPVVIRLSADLVGPRLGRRLRIVKYRGSDHAPDQVPMVIDRDGIQLPFEARTGEPVVATPHDRVGTGVPRLDQVLGGGVYRGSTMLISGAPGTAKTTLSTSIALAASERGERTLYVSFDELPDNIVRNVASVGLDLAPHRERGLLTMRAYAAWRALPEEHLLRILHELDAIRPDVLVIDPISALLKPAGPTPAYLSIDRLLDETRTRAITTVLTSLTAGDAASDEGTLSRASTLADTWITLDYRVLRGERNRTISIVKSRGSAHSNQVREVRLSSRGIELHDTYPYGSDVLLGTARLHHEQLERERMLREEEERDARLRELEEALAAVRQQREEADREERRLSDALRRQQATDRADDERTERDHHAIAERRGDEGLEGDAP